MDGDPRAEADWNHIRALLIFSLPGVIPDGVTIGDQVRLLDVLPTVLDLMGIKQEPHLEGVSLEPLIAGDGSPDESKTAPRNMPFDVFRSACFNVVSVRSNPIYYNLGR